MTTTYLIPGIGVDERLFKNLKLNGPIKSIHWIPIFKGESLREYALRLAQQIDTSEPFSILGVSFGGMCAVEIAKVYKPIRTILISSAKTKYELPVLLRPLKLLPIHNLLGNNTYIKLANCTKLLFGIRSIENKELFKKMLEGLPKDYFKRASDAIINWDNETYPDNLIHLHGDNDNIIPFRNIKNPLRINGGSHVMVLDKAAAITDILNEYLKN